MRLRKIQLRTLGIALALTLCAAPAHADKGGNGRGYGYHKNNNDNDRVGAAINKKDRQAIHRYMQGHKHGSCPPGLAKKHNGCLPPGQARKYEIGKKLPSGVAYVQVPYSLRRHLEPLQPGYEYVRVDNDVLMVSKADRIIVDAVTLMSDLAQ